MYFHYVIFSICVWITAAGAAANATSLAAVLPLAPQCALNCFASENIPLAALSDPGIVCTNTTMELTLSICIQGHCNYTEQAMFVAFFEADVCEGYPMDSRSWPVAITGLICAGVVFIVVILRFYSRLTIARQLGIDDYIILVATVILLVLGVIGIYNCIANGFGRHLWNIDPLRYVELMKIFYASEIMYLIAITLIKASILVFYLRIFQSSWFWTADIFVLILTVVAGLALSIAAVFQCTPISGIWSPIVPHKCVNANILAFVSGAITVLTDIMILVLPISELMKHRMSGKKKFRIIIMFSFGSLACVTSIVRLVYMFNFAKSKDATYDNSCAIIWTCLEVTVAMICACLPAFRGILSRWLPVILENSIHDSEPSKPKSPNNMSTPLSHLPRLEKTGPSYNKWPMHSSYNIPSPMSEVFPLGPHDTKIWINPRFNYTGELVDFCPITPTREAMGFEEATEMSLSQIPSRSTDTSLWALEGPRLSEEIGRTLARGQVGLHDGWEERGYGEGIEAYRGNGNDEYKDLDLERAERGVASRRFLSSPKVRKVRQKRPRLRRLSMPLPMGQNALRG